MAFCEGCLELRDEPLLFPFCERFRECPLDLRPSPRSLERCRLLGESEAGDGDILLFAAFDRDGDLFWVVVDSHVEEK